MSGEKYLIEELSRGHNRDGFACKAREMLVASELCKRLTTTYAAENAHITAFGETVEETYNDFNFHSKFSDRERKLVRKSMEIEKRDRKYYLEYLGTLLKKHSQGWWD